MSTGSWIALLVSALGILYQLVGHHVFVVGGRFRKVSPLNNDQCERIGGLEGCEKLVIHQPSGVVYLACGSYEERMQYFPFWQNFNLSGAGKGYVATYDPRKSGAGAVRRLKIEGLKGGITTHGMDVVPSASDPSLLYVYLVNHRPPSPSAEVPIEESGADSVIEIFTTRVGKDTLKHVRTIRDPQHIRSPNDISGSSDGKSFYVTNDDYYRAGRLRRIRPVFNLPISSVAYCHIDKGCHLPLDWISGANGVIRVNETTLAVTNNSGGKVHFYQISKGPRLARTSTADVGRVLDNLAIDQDGNVWASAYVNMFNFRDIATGDKGVNEAPAAAYRLSRSRSAKGRETWEPTRMFEDDGSYASGTTTAAYDARLKKLYMTGLFAPWLTVCSL